MNIHPGKTIVIPEDNGNKVLVSIEFFRFERELAEWAKENVVRSSSPFFPNNVRYALKQNGITFQDHLIKSKLCVERDAIQMHYDVEGNLSYTQTG